MPKHLAPLLVILTLIAAPLSAEPPSLVDRLMSILRKENLPKLEMDPERAPKTLPSPVPDNTPAPARKGPMTTPNLLPIYDLERGGDEQEKPRALPFFSSSPLHEPPPGILSLVILIPDSDRDAARVFAQGRAAQDAASNKHPEWLAKDAFLFAPQFLNPEDISEKQTVLLRWAGGGWIYGADSALPETASVLQGRGLSSYAVLDFVLLALARRERFPDLERVVIAGAGAGGDFVQRYAALGTAPSILRADDIRVRFVAGNAWSYLYFDKTRLIPPKDDPLTPRTDGVFAEPLKDSCASANVYPYGFESLPPYGKKQGENALRLRYDQRNVIYLAGKNATIEAKDTSPQACALQLQGKNIAERAQIYFQHLVKLYGEESMARSQRLYLAPDVKESADALWQSPCGLSALFGDGACKPEEGKMMKTLN